MRRSYIRGLFNKAINTGEGSALLDAVFTKWTCKIMHARVNDWFSARRDNILTAKGKHSRGGHTLRDMLYALSKRTKKSKKKPVSVCTLEPTGQKNRKRKPVKNPNQSINQSINLLHIRQKDQSGTSVVLL